jgi:hypothetical protein
MSLNRRHVVISWNLAEYSSMASTTTSHFSLPDAQGRRSVVFTLPPNPVDRLGGALRFLAIDDSIRRGKLELIRSTPGLRVFNFTAPTGVGDYTSTVKYRAVASDGQVERGSVFFDVTGKSGCCCCCSRCCCCCGSALFHAWYLYGVRWLYCL